MAKRLPVILFCCCLLSATIFAEVPQTHYQQEQVKSESFSHKKWEDLRSKVKISEPKPKKKKQEEEKKDEKKTTWEIDPDVKLIIKWTLFAVLIGLLLFLVLYTLGINPFRSKKNGKTIQIDIETIAEHLDEADLDPFLLDAIKTGNYKLAIRLYYLQIVQRLNDTGKIKWKRYKTNKNYINEMRSQNDYPLFKELTLLYEKCWFGPDIISKNHYEQICPQFINYVKNIPVIE